MNTDKEDNLIMFKGLTAEEAGKRVAEAMTSIADKIKYDVAYQERTDTSIDLLIDQARLLMEEIEEVNSPENTPEELEYIEALEMQLDRYLLAIKYS